MKILGLDISTKTGFAFIENGELTYHGLISEPYDEHPDLVQDFAMLDRARKISWKIYTSLLDFEAAPPDLIVIEQTNLGRSRTDQKQLEFIHCTLLSLLRERSFEMSKKVRYVDTSQWRSKLGIKLSKDQRKHNKAVKSKEIRGKITPKHLTVWWVNQKYGKGFLKKDHDVCDAVALAAYGEVVSSPSSVPKIDVDAVIKAHAKIMV